MGGEGCFLWGLEVVGRVFLYSSYTHPIFILYKSFGIGSIYLAWRRGCKRGTGCKRYGVGMLKKERVYHLVWIHPLSYRLWVCKGHHNMRSVVVGVCKRYMPVGSAVNE